MAESKHYAPRKSGKTEREKLIMIESPLFGKQHYALIDHDFEQMLISAERYACGRMSYIVVDTISYIKALLPLLSDRCITIMIHDIEEENAMCERSGGKIKMGMESDHQSWLAFKEELDKELKRRAESERSNQSSC